MKKLIFLILLITTTYSLFAIRNYSEIGTIEVAHGIDIAVGIDSTGLLQVRFGNTMTIVLKAYEIKLFTTMLDVNLAMINTVVQEKIDIYYSQNTNRFYFGYYRQMMSRFSTTGGGIEDNCFVKLTYYVPSHNFSKTSVHLTASDVRSLNSLISEAIAKAQNMQRQLAVMDEKFKDVK